jgi:hypothetical protein
MAPGRRWARRLAVVAMALGGASAVGLLACRDDTPSPPLCRGSVQADAPAVSAGTPVIMTVTVANLDDDIASTADVSWTVSGGGTLDHPASHVDLAPQNDALGNPIGISGSATNTFLTQGPTGSYTVRATVAPFAGCPAAAYEATVNVSGTAPDAGGNDAGGDAGANDATADDAGNDAGADDAGNDAAADALADAPADGG